MTPGLISLSTPRWFRLSEAVRGMTDEPRPITDGTRNIPLEALKVYAQLRANSTGQVEYIKTQDGIIEIHPHPSAYQAYRGGN